MPQHPCLNERRTGTLPAPVTNVIALACAALLHGLAAPGAMAQATSAPVPAPGPSATQAASAGPAGAVQTLIDQARHWQQRQRPDLATQTWNKLLAIDPRQPDALQGLATLSIEAGRFDEAGGYVDRLRQVQPGNASLDRLSRQVRTRTTSQSLLATARQQAQAGQMEAAAKSYRQALGGQPPSDDLALEYYQTLGGTREGWDEARRGLERLAQAQPSQSGVQLAYARHLSYRESTRREAIQRLSTLAVRDDAPAAVRQDARTAWRQALLWMGAGADSALVRQYVATVGEDPRLSAQMQARGSGSSGSGSAAAPAVSAAAATPARGAGTSAEPASAATSAAARTAAAPREAAPPAARTASTAPARAPEPVSERTDAPRGTAQRQAYAALNAGDVDAAATQFEALLRQRPLDTESLAGLGLVRLRQERFDESVELLGRAVATPSGARWKPMERSARHWQQLHEAHAARLAGDTDRAVRLARASIELDPKEPEAQVLLGDLLVGQGRLAPAEAAYRAALQADARHARATAGLIGVLGASGRVEQAQAMVRDLDAEQLARLGGAGALRANQQRLQAEMALQRGDVAGAQALLEQAAALAPAAPWVRLALGQLLVRQNRSAEARAQLDAMVVPTSGGERADALHARALLQAELKDWAGVMQTLEQVPRRERSIAMDRLQRRAAVQAQAAEAVAMYRAGQVAPAAALLAEAETAAGQDPELVGAVAGAYLDLGNEARASQLIRATLAAQPQAGPALLLRHAGLLLQTRQDVELAGVLRQLMSMAQMQQLGPSQRRDLDELRLGYSVRQADLLREAGDLASAWEAIAPLLQERPAEPRLQMALARMHLSAGEPDTAIALYETVLRERPDELDAWLGLAAAADARKDRDTAEQALEQARRIAPDRPEVLAQQARHYRARGQFAKAAEYLRLAMAAQRPAAVAQWGQPRMASNPFASRRLPGDTGLPAPAGGLPAPAFAALAAPAAAPAATLPADLDQLPPTAAGLPSPASADSPVTRALRWRTTGAPAPARSALAAPTTQAAQVAQGAALPPLPAPVATPLAASPRRLAAASPAPVRPAAARRSRSLADELAEVQAERGPGSRIEGGGALRSRDGEGGFGKLDTVQAPVEGRIAIDEVGHVVVRASPVFLSAGSVGAEPGTRRRHGTLALDPTGVTTPGDQSDAGIGLGVGIETATISADIGTVPVGFAVAGAVGGVRWEDAIGSSGLRLMVEGSRRALNDSLLSFAGTTDARTGRTWGGVRATGLRSQLSWEQDDVGLYGYGGAHALTGRAVESNSRIELGGGGYWRPRSTPDDRLEIGLNLGYQHHRHNLGGYTWGHGGYFSPQHLLALTVPLNWIGRSGRLSWGVQGSAGLQTYREDAAPYFPTDAAAQSALESLVAAGQAPTARYAARSDSGLTLNLGGALEYQITRQLDIGTRIGFERAPQYTQGVGSVYLRFSLDPRGGGSPGLRAPAGPTLY
ncbi:cellulose biosynthesis protein BcsC [Sphaerotilus uruguayifluvii]|uniref:Tetratricopeptide (TPR) repeat protein n=1 Tax=Sphaerotilus uruguayifluvii TaxID=2735897 RepID=A0ABX2FZA5_9BURK|nr:cellulose biosynthesis protein BcsC [Leptothrix sp. C29]NRT55368.1 tetratricopeptide (TPR) repeat protein [Leptothrix sp. C29]